MVKREYSPKIGDVVTAQGQTGIFKIVEVSKDGIVAKLQPFNFSRQETFGQIMANIPRGVLTPFEEDASQAAARIVREATKD
jgi:hypothetical protein